MNSIALLPAGGYALGGLPCSFGSKVEFLHFAGFLNRTDHAEPDPLGAQN